MAARTQRFALAVAGALVALGPVASATSASPSAAAPSAGACTSSTGITVVVDMTAFGDGVQVRCAPQPVHSGFEALTKAGFTYQGTTQFPGLLCRIDGEPASDPCHGAPPANAYWAYWHASRGGSWTYSTSGAGSRVPPPGTVEGWAFGDDAEPSVDPPAPPPSTTTTRPTSTPTTTGTTGGTGGSTPPPTRSSGGTTTTSASGATDASTSTTAGAASESTTSTTDRSTAAVAGGDGGSAGPDESAAAVSSDAADGSGSPVGLVVGLATAAGLAVAGVVAARRRRSGEEGLA
jgi:hypothetical protein